MTEPHYKCEHCGATWTGGAFSHECSVRVLGCPAFLHAPLRIALYAGPTLIAVSGNRVAWNDVLRLAYEEERAGGCTACFGKPSAPDDDALRARAGLPGPYVICVQCGRKLGELG